MRRLFLLAALALVVPSPATASQLIDRNATGVSLATNGKGEALLTYRAAGKVRHVLAWGGLNAIPPTTARAQVAVRLDYSGGRGRWKRFGGVCDPYDGPPLAWVVAACEAPDGSYWAVQSWQRALANYGVAPTPAQSAWELRLSHWTGPLPALNVKLDWAYRRYHHLYGSMTYGGTGVFGFRSTRFGVPLDTFGRNLYVDTLNSAYGAGWRRENSFLTHRNGGRGTFCYGFFPHGKRPAGTGTHYRASVIGPGMTPDLAWQGEARGAYDRAADAVANDEQRSPDYADPSCKVN
jgi:hypothetical protein